jgi:hypothetical protein
LDIDDKITRAKELIAEREAIDALLDELFRGGEPLSRMKGRKCGQCGELGHQARACPKRADPVNQVEH